MVTPTGRPSLPGSTSRTSPTAWFRACAMPPELLAGVVAITVTPFDEDGAVDEAAYVKLVDRLVGGGIPVITPNGNTSEFYALTVEETGRAVELTVRTAAGRAAVLAGVGHDVGSAIAAA